MFINVFILQMFPGSAKIIKGGNAEPDQFEASISQALLELEMNSDLKSQLRELYITKAKEIETNNKKVSFFNSVLAQLLIFFTVNVILPWKHFFNFNIGNKVIIY